MHRGEIDETCLGLILINARNVVLATGGPGGLYRDSVYPPGQTGSIGLGFLLGAAAHNLTESQFGLASRGFRWNLSGSYQQVIPRYVSTDAGGKDEREFLNEHFPTMKALAGAIFRKGYQWPFDASKIKNHGSSLIDLLVYRETMVHGRRVFLDYRQNPSGVHGLEAFCLDALDEEAHTYLKNSGALEPLPIERLLSMNPSAVQLFLDHGIDLKNERLECAVCAQHNNGGLLGNLWWESNVRHLFPVGEVNGTHGVARPGGAALNAGQVGALRAALHIAKHYSDPPPGRASFVAAVEPQMKAVLEQAGKMTGPARGEAITPALALKEIRARMSTHGAQIRNPAAVGGALKEAWALYEKMNAGMTVAFPGALPDAIRTLDLGLTHALYLEAIQEYLKKGGKSRGSYLVLDPAGETPAKTLGREWRFALTEPNAFVNQKILEVRWDEAAGVKLEWVDIRPIPEEDEWFEKVWSDYEADRVIFEEESDD
jgi:succinate dehydrogenase/fumarate reductase flavoprotein subunit